MSKKIRAQAPAETKREAYERDTKPQRDRLAAWTFKELPDTSELVGLMHRALNLQSAGAVVGYDLISDIANAAGVLDTSEALGVALPLQLPYNRLPPEARDMRSRLQAVMRTCDRQRHRDTLTDAEAERLRVLAEQLNLASGEVARGKRIKKQFDERNKGGRPPISNKEAEDRMAFYNTWLERKAEGASLRMVADDEGLEYKTARAWKSWAESRAQNTGSA